MSTSHESHSHRHVLTRAQQLQQQQRQQQQQAWRKRVTWCQHPRGEWAVEMRRQSPTSRAPTGGVPVRPTLAQLLLEPTASHLRTCLGRGLRPRGAAELQRQQLQKRWLGMEVQVEIATATAEDLVELTLMAVLQLQLRQLRLIARRLLLALRVERVVRPEGVGEGWEVGHSCLAGASRRRTCSERRLWVDGVLAVFVGRMAKRSVRSHLKICWYKGKLSCRW